MGCSSGRLEVEGDYEGDGIVHAYMAAGCPAVVSFFFCGLAVHTHTLIYIHSYVFLKVANLWDVSDKDIDRFLSSFVDDWLANKSDALTTVLPRARHACKLRNLVGCSPVCYGVPVKFCLHGSNSSGK